MSDCHKVVWEKPVSKQLGQLPTHVEKKFFAWVAAVELLGLREVRKRSGYHDEPLSGERSGQRSLRLNRAYRVLYCERFETIVKIIEVIEVNKHAY